MCTSAAHKSCDEHVCAQLTHHFRRLSTGARCRRRLFVALAATFRLFLFLIVILASTTDYVRTTGSRSRGSFALGRLTLRFEHGTVQLSEHIGQRVAQPLTARLCRTTIVAVFDR
jgi:hypothetical protein